MFVMVYELKLFPPLENVLDIVEKYWTQLKKWPPLRKLFAPPGEPSWLRACLGAILSGISAFTSGGQTFLSEEHLKEFANAH